MPCREHLSQLRHIESELKEKGVEVVVVTFEAGFVAQSYVEDENLQWPLLVDETRDVYHAYDMLSAGFWDIWGPSTWWAYIRGVFGGHKLKASEGDVSQRGGDVLIDPDGVVRLHHVGDGPADRPTIEAIRRLLPQL